MDQVDLVNSVIHLSEHVLTLAAYQGGLASPHASRASELHGSATAELAGHMAALCTQSMLLAALVAQAPSPDVWQAVDEARLASLAAGFECVCILVTDASLAHRAGEDLLLHELLCWFGSLPLSGMRFSPQPAPACDGGVCGGLADGLALVLDRLSQERPASNVWRSLLEGLGHVAGLLTQDNDESPLQLLSSAALMAACSLVRRIVLTHPTLFTASEAEVSGGRTGGDTQTGGSWCIKVIRRLVLGAVGSLCRQAVVLGVRGKRSQEASAQFFLELSSVIYAALSASSDAVLAANVEVRGGWGAGGEGERRRAAAEGECGPSRSTSTASFMTGPCDDADHEHLGDVLCPPMAARVADCVSSHCR